jgi:hypothetical protein
VTVIACPYIQRYSKVGCLFSRPLALTKYIADITGRRWRYFSTVLLPDSNRMWERDLFWRSRHLHTTKRQKRIFVGQRNLVLWLLVGKETWITEEIEGMNKNKGGHKKYGLLFISVDFVSRLLHLYRETQNLLSYSVTHSPALRFASIDLVSTTN